MVCGPTNWPHCNWLSNPGQGKAWHRVRGRRGLEKPCTAPPAPWNCLGTRSEDILRRLMPKPRSYEDGMLAGHSGYLAMAKALLTVLEKKGRWSGLLELPSDAKLRKATHLPSQEKRKGKETSGWREYSPWRNATTGMWRNHVHLSSTDSIVRGSPDLSKLGKWEGSDLLHKETSFILNERQ